MFAQGGTTCSIRLLPEHALSSRVARINPVRTRMRGCPRRYLAWRLRGCSAWISAKPSAVRFLLPMKREAQVEAWRRPNSDILVWTMKSVGETIPTPCLPEPRPGGAFSVAYALSRPHAQSEPRLGDRRGSGLTTFTGGIAEGVFVLSPTKRMPGCMPMSIPALGTLPALEGARCVGRKHEGERRVANRVIPAAPGSPQACAEGSTKKPSLADATRAGERLLFLPPRFG